MSYEVLARRWRPQTFEDVAGQSHVTTTLKNAIESDKLPHALLLCGPRGVGKTSIARIVARALNCDEGKSATPCGKCTSCVEIAGSTSLDVQEIDAASNTGVDNVREIRESIRYSAGPGKHRIFIIDEVHMLSQAAFNALLKTLEEPPPQSLFIFATTDPQKIPATVLSRVQRFDLKRLPANEVLALLRQICKTEGLEAPESVLWALVRESEGCARDALTLLDRLVSGLGTKFGEEDAATVLDLVDRRVLWEILDPVLGQDPAAALEATRRGLDKGVDPNRLAADLLAEIRHLSVVRVVDEPSALIDLSKEEIDELARRAKEHDAELLQQLFRVLLARLQDFAFAPRPAHALEMAVVRLATLPATQTLQEVLAKLDALGAGTPAPSSGGGDSSGGGGSRKAGAKAEPAPRGAGRRKPEASAAAAAPQAAAPADVRPGAESPGAPPEPPAPPSEELAPPPGAPDPEPPRESRRSLEEQSRLRQEAKKHPAVTRALEILDAEIRDIRPPTDVRPPTGGPA